METLKNLLDMLYSSENGMMYFYIISAAIALILILLIIITLISGKNDKSNNVSELVDNTNQDKSKDNSEKESTIVNDEVEPLKTDVVETKLDKVELESQPVVEEMVVTENSESMENMFENLNKNVFDTSEQLKDDNLVSEDIDMPKVKETVSNDVFLERLNALKEKK